MSRNGSALPLRGEAPEPVGFDLRPPLAPGSQVELGMRFERPVPGLEEEQPVRLVDWHPRLWWDYETHASYDVGLEAPDGIAVAASAPPDPISERYRASGIRSFGFFFASGHDQLEAPAGDTLVRVLFPPSMKACGEALLEYAVDAIEFYRGRFGFYPHPSLTILPGEPRSIGGYPFATGLVLIHSMHAFERLPDTHWRWITAHEIAHQYWLEHVLPKEPEHGFGWLMIGLGLWMDREYARARGMERLHGERLERYAASMRRGLNTTVLLPPEQIRELRFDYNSIVTHNKAFGIISALAAVLGRETFDRVHARALSEYGGRRLGTADFRRLAEEESGLYLGWLFDPLLRTNDFASYEILSLDHDEEAGEPLARVRLKQRGTLRLPVPVEARFEDGTRRRLWTDRLRGEQVLEFRGGSPVTEVVVDPDREFPLVNPPPDPDFQELAKRLTDMPWTGVGDAVLPLYERAVGLDLTEADLLAKLGLLLYDGGYYEWALDAFDRIARQSAAAAGWRRSMAVAWQGILLDLLARREEALARYREALSIEDFPPVTHSQYDLRIDRAWLERRLEEPFVRP